MKKKNKRFRQSDAYKQVLQFLINNANKAYNHRQISSKLDRPAPKDVNLILQLLQRDGKIEQIDRGRYMYRRSDNDVIGRLDFNSRGQAYLVSESLEKDLKIKHGDTLDGFHGDEVSARVSYDRGSSKMRTRVTKVLSRARESYVATLQQAARAYFAVADNARIHTDFYIPEEHLNGAKNGDKVLIKYRDWPAKAKNPYGKVIEIFGPAGENTTEMHAIVAEFGFETSFPPEVEHAAELLPKKISQEEISTREDFRKKSTFTIDPVDAKDFDDALSIDFLEDGNVEVGVHIADVAHYVEEGSTIDKEAIKRATSVYLVDRTIPMLPERLSNELCSLRPHEDSLCYAVIFKLNNQGNVLKYSFAKTIIHSDHRLSYEQAQEVIKGQEHVLKKEINTLNSIANQLRVQRFNNGSINFETVEFRFDLNEDGKPLGVSPKVRFDAHKLIEEYMLLANRHVAMHLYTKFNKAPIPYRVHEEPSVEKLQDFARTALTFGYKIDVGDYRKLSKSINAMVQAVQGTLEADILQPLAIRSMEKAYYTTKKNGHFGLAFEHYAHFTSPIRRYPDLITHRILFRLLNNKKIAPQDTIEQWCDHCSQQEQKAVSAERASVKYKQVEYLSGFKGEEFEGMISGMTEWGMYVEIVENKCEGMIRLKDMSGDHYNYHSDLIKVIGQRKGKTFEMGDRIWIRIKGTDLQRRTIDFELVNE
ncbi:MAG: ribonuclease R [Bacteroidia bacterium]